MQLSEKLLGLRKSHNLTQEELAQALYVSRQSVYKWETNRALPDVAKIKQICDYFAISADELLDIHLSEEPHPVNQEAEQMEITSTEIDKMISPEKPKKKTKIVLLASVLVLILFGSFWAYRFTIPMEIRKAITLEVIPQEIRKNFNSSVSERDFLSMLSKLSCLDGKSCPESLKIAASNATNEQLSREKAAYWLYCTHIWTKIDAQADLSIGTHNSVDPVTQRDVYQDLNRLGQTIVDGSDQPWEWTLCDELKETGELFEIDDDSPEMNDQINRILFGPYYTAVTFCLAQKSFFSENSLMEITKGRFLPKEKITGYEAITGAYRLYGSW